MRVGLASALLALAGCCPVLIVSGEVDPPEGADEAIELIHDRYSAAFGGTQRTVEVTWVEYIEADGEALGGATISCLDIWVAVSPGESPSDTGLAHELAHCYAGHVPDSGRCPFWWETADGRHSEGWIWERGGLVSITRQELSSLGL